MKEYFLLKSRVSALFETLNMDNKMYQRLMTMENFEKIAEDKIVYYKYSDDVEMPDVMMSPTFMVGKSIHDIVSLYDDTIEWKSMQIFPDGIECTRDNIKSYWIPLLPQCRCLHDESVILPNGTVKNVIIDKTKIRNMDIFRIEKAGVSENLVAVSLALAESISRRNAYGVVFERIEVK